MRRFVILAVIISSLGSFAMPARSSAPFIADAQGEAAWSVKGDAGFTPDILTDETGKLLPHKVALRAVEEGVCRWAYTLYPDSAQEIHIFWKSDQREMSCTSPEKAPASFRSPQSVEIDRPDSVWKTSDGIYIGMPLQELVALNGRQVMFTGFEGQYGGRCCADPATLTPETILFLSYDANALKDPDVKTYFDAYLKAGQITNARAHMVAQKQVSSDIPDTIKKKLDIRVKRFMYVFPETPEEPEK